ncbi:MAG TPA: hypothetical protein VFS26_00670 [Solirubrobacterales bacterium]|nr:hypothetical protein [Solirubrobacterales bacterium]
MAVMMNPRGQWTDERLDDLSAKVDQGFADLKTEMREGFDRIDKRFEQVDKRFEQIDKRFEQVDKRFEQVDKRFEQVDKRMERLEDAFFAMNRMLFAGGFVIVAAILGGSALAN